MTALLIIEKAIEEVERKTFGATAQFLAIHSLVYVDGKPRIARVDTDKDDQAIVYFTVDGQTFFLAVYVDVKPTVSVRWVGTEAYHAVYFRASSESLSLTELARLTKLKSTRGRDKGDKRSTGGTGVLWKRSTIDFEPDPEAGGFEGKLTKLLDYLERDAEGIEKLVTMADGYIQVYSSFHNGNTMIGGHHLERDHIQRMSRLRLEIDFDISASGNFFK